MPMERVSRGLSPGSGLKGGLSPALGMGGTSLSSPILNSYEMAKLKFRPVRRRGFSGVKAYIVYVEVLKKRGNAAGWTFLRRHAHLPFPIIGSIQSDIVTLAVNVINILTTPDSRVGIIAISA